MEFDTVGEYREYMDAARDAAEAAARTADSASEAASTQAQRSPQDIIASKKRDILQALRMAPAPMFEYKAPNHDGPIRVFGFAYEETGTRRASRKRARIDLLDKLTPLTGQRPDRWRVRGGAMPTTLEARSLRPARRTLTRIQSSSLLAPPSSPRAASSPRTPTKTHACAPSRHRSTQLPGMTAFGRASSR